MVGVRSFEPADRATVRDISYRTGYMRESAESFWRHKESWADLWTSYYTGLGAALMERWLRQLGEAASPGCHLLTLVENMRALRFFEKSGFRNHGNPLWSGGCGGSGGNGCTSRSWCGTRDRRGW